MKTSIICLIICAIAGAMLFKCATDENTYAVIQMDIQGNEYITDQYVSWDDCMSQPHYVCVPMNEIAGE